MFEFVVPDDIDDVNTVTEVPTGQKLKFVEFVRATLLTDRRFALNSEALESQLAVRTAIRGKLPGQAVQIHPNDFSILLEAAKKPEYGQSNQGAASGYGSAAYIVLPFIDAIKNAKKVKNDG